ncbi:MAG: HAD family hydrolase [Coriobacteriia bacterium]|nr:HAD family hydrolase [Coriobacteriia bacterium]
MKTDSLELSRRVAGLKAVLFDLDGTLIDTEELILASARHATKEVLGEALPDSVLRHNIGVPLRIQMAEYAPEHVDELLASYRKHNDIVHDDLIREYAGTETALESIRERGLPMAIVTSKSRPVAQRGVDFFGLGRFFEFIVGYEDTTVHKPRAEPILEAARRLGVSAGECIYVGDSPHDMAAGVAAGALTAAAMWGPFADRVLQPGPDFALAHLGDLAELLRGEVARFLA